MKKLLIGCLFLSGCATAQTRAQIDYDNASRRINSWVGSPVDDLISAWGPPASQFKSPNGNIIYTWVQGGDPIMWKPAGFSGLVPLQFYCKSIVTTSSEGKILSASLEGNACK